MPHFRGTPAGLFAILAGGMAAIRFAVAADAAGAGAGAGAGGPRNVLLFMPDDLQFYWDEAPPPASTSSRKQQTNQAENAAVLLSMSRVRDEGVVFTKSYTSAPKCAPSRFGLMTGRFPSRGEYSQAFRSSTDSRTDVQVPSAKLSGGDLTSTLPAALSAAGFATIESGKWHIGAGQSRAHSPWDDYEGSVALVESAGFDTAAAVFITNMDTTGATAFSHNNEWLVAEANGAVDEAVAEGRPFFLYVAPTGPHAPSNEAALTDFAMTDTPAGTLSEAPVSGMPDRASVLSRAASAPGGGSDRLIGAIGCDDALGALMAHLEAVGELADTLIIITMDHGQLAKDQIYEGGVRTMLAMRHPASIAAGSVVRSVGVTNLDIAPTIFDAVLAAGSPAAAGYDTDGVSLWEAATSATALGDGDVGGALANRKCLVFEIDFVRAVSCDGRYKFVSGTKAAPPTAQYPGAADEEQLYDLIADPTEQVNRIADTALAAVAAVMREWVVCHDAATSRGGAGCDTAALNPLNVDAVDDDNAPAVTTTAPAAATTSTITTTTTTTTTTTEAPTTAPGVLCADSTEWSLKAKSNKAARGCTWVAANVGKRCKRTGVDGTTGFESCPVACDVC